MKKNFVLALVFGALVFASFGFVSAANQNVGGTVSDSISFVVNPTIDFGSIPYSTDPDFAWDNLGTTSTTLDLTGSDTASGKVNVDVAISDAPLGFFNSLMEFDLGGNWTKVASFLGPLQIDENTAPTLGVRLHGATSGFGAGAKNAVITYTASAMPPA